MNEDEIWSILLKSIVENADFGFGIEEAELKEGGDDSYIFLDIYFFEFFFNLFFLLVAT